MGLDQEELLPSFQQLDCCLAGKKAEEQVEEVVVVVAEGVVGVVVLLVVAAFPIEGGRGGHSTIEVIIPLVRSVPPPENLFPQ